MLSIGPYRVKPYILAPMAGVSQMPFRRLALQFGAGLAPTELISSKGLVYENMRTKSYLLHDSSVESPFSVQLFGGECDSMAIAAQKAVSLGAHIIDINMGCPVKKVTKTNAGSALMVDYARAKAMVIAMKKAVGDVPVTAKIRSGWDDSSQNYLDVARALEDAGISALAIHPRTRAMGYSGSANWTHIKNLKAALQIPVIGNGDIRSAADGQRMFDETGCDAVMIGRAALGNPWIFKSFNNESKHDNDYDSVLKTIFSHFEAHQELHFAILGDDKRYSRLEAEQRAVQSFRSHLIWYSRGYTKGAVFREQITKVECKDEVCHMIGEFFAKSVKDCPDETEEGVNYASAFG